MRLCRQRWTLNRMLRLTPERWRLLLHHFLGLCRFLPAVGSWAVFAPAQIPEKTAVARLMTEVRSGRTWLPVGPAPRALHVPCAVAGVRKQTVSIASGNCGRKPSSRLLQLVYDLDMLGADNTRNVYQFPEGATHLHNWIVLISAICCAIETIIIMEIIGSH